MTEFVSILIPTHNRRDVLLQTLASLRQLRVPDGTAVELIVVANACTDDTVVAVSREIASLSFPAKCVVEDVAGLSVARNRCVREASGDILAFLDDDVWVEQRWLDGLLHVFENFPADIVGGRVFLWWKAVPKPEWISPLIEDRISANDQGDQVREYSGGKLAIGANIAFRRKVFERVGLFRVGLGRTGQALLGGEETELVDRALKAGMRLFYAPDAVVKHWVSPNRITNGYLFGVSFAAGQTAIFRLERFGPTNLLYQLMGRSARFLYHSASALTARMRNDRRSFMTHQSHRAQALGGFSGLWLRCRGRSPVMPDEQLVRLEPRSHQASVANPS